MHHEREAVAPVSTQDERAQQRRYFRANVDFPVTVILPGEEMILGGTALDLSGGGMRVATPEDLLAGQNVVLRFTLPDGSSEMLLRGKIVMSFFDASRGRYAHGIAFTQYAQPDQDRIVAFVHELQRRGQPG